MHCNIDSKGKAARLIAGFILTLAGLWGLGICVSIARFDHWLLFVTIALIMMGAFAIFEGWSGWCALRAMGFRTRL